MIKPTANCRHLTRWMPSPRNLVCMFGAGAHDAVPHLIKAFNGPDEKVRSSVVTAVVAIGSEAIPYLIEALRDPADETRTKAADVMARLFPS
jgi:HEAT repeat protein